MKTLGILIFFQATYCYSFSQVDRKTSVILERILRKDHPQGTLVYTDKLDDYVILNIKESLKKQIFVGKLASKKGRDTFILSKSELKYIDSILRKLHLVFWKDSIFSNSKRISKDSLWSRIDNQNRKSYENLINATSDSSRNLAKRNWIDNANTFQFSIPIFLRSKSIFFFYYIRLCGSMCGVSDLSVYRIENGVYKKWFLISGGAF